MNNELIKIGLIFGGVSKEHQVSVNSAKTIIKAFRESLNAFKYKVISIYIDQEGEWHGKSFSEEILDIKQNQNESTSKKRFDNKDLSDLFHELKEVDIWFPIIHGPNGEDGTIQGLFKLTRKPFVGSDVLGSALGMDKIAMKAVFCSSGLPQVDYLPIHNADLLNEEEIITLTKKIESSLGYPCFIKPANLGSSVGISKAYNKTDFLNGFKLAQKLDKRIVVEKSIIARELECAVLGKKEILSSCVGEVNYNSDWYDYDTKYSQSSSKITIPAEIPNKISRKVRELSLLACKVISVEGIARVDFFYEEESGNLWINEINTLPGFTSQSMYPMLWDASGINISQLVARLVESAKE